jgi:hypothetical protein
LSEGQPTDSSNTPSQRWVIDEERAFAFLESLQKEFELYAGLVAKSELQRHHIEQRDEEALLKLIAEKQDDIEALQKVHTDFAEERKHLDETEMGHFSCIDGEIDKVLQATETLLQKLVENETRDMNALQAFQEEHLDKMTQLEKGRQMTKAYFSKGSGKKMDRSV